MAENREPKIEKGIPVPKPVRKTYSKYPFDKMEAGDSFLVPPASRRGAQSSASLQSKDGKRFTGRTTPDGSYRIWRAE